MTRPLDRNAQLPEIGRVDREGGEFWVENPFDMPTEGLNLSAYERNRLWLNLGGEQSIHGSPTGGQEQERGCISLSPRDADDVYSILSQGSTVRIRR